jgi:hypothetical protein
LKGDFAVYFVLNKKEFILELIKQENPVMVYFCEPT